MLRKAMTYLRVQLCFLTKPGHGCGDPCVFSREVSCLHVLGLDKSIKILLQVRSSLLQEWATQIFPFPRQGVASGSDTYKTWKKRR